MNLLYHLKTMHFPAEWFRLEGTLRVLDPLLPLDSISKSHLYNLVNDLGSLASTHRATEPIVGMVWWEHCLQFGL